MRSNACARGVRDFFWWRAACFCACAPSGGALLLKVYGLAQMRQAVLLLALPCCIGLVGVWLWARRAGRGALADALAIGFLGGLLGTLGYDLSRVPFLLTGQRLLAPISAYGLWIMDAPFSSRFTEVTGWLYHFSNGITFGLMYALFMRGRHWGWGIVWAFALETIALVSPFARIFYLSGNYSAVAIAYLGHVAYGLPLGWLVYSWDETRDQLSSAPAAHKWMPAVLAAAAVAWPLVSPANARRDALTVSGVFRIDGRRLAPGWLRVARGSEIRIVNPGREPTSVRVKQSGEAFLVAGGDERAVTFPRPGIYQVFVESSGQSESSFVMVEPVEEAQ